MLSRKLLPAGEILNRYRIESVIGVGGFGVTYLAMEPVQKSYVAIKEYFPKRFANRQTSNTIVPNGASDDQKVFKWGLKRFLDEARVLARLDHPNIIKVQRYFEMHGTAYLVMDYCDGEPLDQYIAAGNGVTSDRLLQIYKLLINALEHVHQYGIIHGDLKPSNVFVRKDGTPVLLDFGSARQEMLRIAFGQVSDGYSPPEFYETSDKVGPWSDIYGLGATFYKLITGMKVPVATDRLQCDTYIPAVHLITKDYNHQFLELIDSSLRLSTSDRPQSISSLKRLLSKSGSFSNLQKASKGLPTKASNLLQHNSSSANLKLVLISLVPLAIFFFIVIFSNRQVEEPLNVEPVKPIVIEDQSLVSESQLAVSKNSEVLPTDNAAFQQSISYLSRVSNSNEISLYSIPQTEFALRSFKMVRIEINNKLNLAFERKTYTYSDINNEYLFKDFWISDINSLVYIATDTKCDYGPTGPVAGFCRRSGRDYKCRFFDLSVKYEYICLSSFSLQ